MTCLVSNDCADVICTGLMCLMSLLALKYVPFCRPLSGLLEGPIPPVRFACQRIVCLCRAEGLNVMFDESGSLRVCVVMSLRTFERGSRGVSTVRDHPIICHRFYQHLPESCEWDFGIVRLFV